MPKKIIRLWTDPQISPKQTTEKNAGHHCYVWFRYFNEETRKWTHPIKRKPAVVLPFSKRSHFLELRALVKVIQFELSVEKWNPITNTYPPPVVEMNEFDIEMEKIKLYSFNQAIDYAYNKKLADWKPRSVQAYQSGVRYLKKSARALNLADKRMCDFELPHFKILLEHVQKENKLSAAGYNRYRTFLSTLVSEMIQWQIVKFNLVHHVSTKQQEINNIHRSPTKDERQIITQTIRRDHPEYFRFLAILYGCTLRPEEITKLQISHLHKKEGIFRVPAGGTKNKTFRNVTIPNWVMDLLMEMNLHNFPPDYYIFSSNANHQSFIPGKRKMHPNTTNHWWRKIVKNKETGLGLEVNQYGFKKMAGDDMVKIQMQVKQLLELPRQQMGHANSRMTEVYVQQHKEVLRDWIKEDMPEL